MTKDEALKMAIEHVPSFIGWIVITLFILLIIAVLYMSALIYLYKQNIISEHLFVKLFPKGKK